MDTEDYLQKLRWSQTTVNAQLCIDHWVFEKKSIITEWFKVIVFRLYLVR